MHRCQETKFGKPKRYAITNAKHPLYKVVLPKAMPHPTKDIDQKEAKQYMPPGSHIWRGNNRGRWYHHLPPHKRHVEKWANHDMNSVAAMHACVRHCWELWCDDNDILHEDVPIKGMFAAWVTVVLVQAAATNENYARRWLRDPLALDVARRDARGSVVNYLWRPTLFFNSGGHRRRYSRQEVEDNCCC